LHCIVLICWHRVAHWIDDTVQHVSEYVDLVIIFIVCIHTIHPYILGFWSSSPSCPWMWSETSTGSCRGQSWTELRSY
jgi:hypothetical protein